MAGDVRQRMVLSALYLFAERGVQGTSIADVLERSGAPRGSVYHHFPGGKDEIVSAAKRRGAWAMAIGSRVEHLHPLYGTADMDAVYERGTSHADADKKLYRARLRKAERNAP